MPIVEGWPIIKSGNITLGNPESGVAVATLWNRREKIVEALDPNSYTVVGQLYSRSEGVSRALRNMLANTNIRHLIIGGADLGGSGEALVCLWEQGLDTDHHIKGIEKASVHKEIPLEAIEKIRQGVKLHDLRSSHNLTHDIKDLMDSLPPSRPWGEPEVYPLAEVVPPARLPSELGSHIVRGKTVGQTWLRITQEIMAFGEDAPTNYGSGARDLSNLVAVVTDEDPNNPHIAEYFDFTREDIDRYVDEFLSPDCPPGVFYTYGQRIHAYGPNKINQAEIMVRKLREDPNDRGAVAILYDPIHDNQLDVAVPMEGFRNPCIVFIQAAVKLARLELSAFFRSNDMFKAWPENAFGLRAFQNKLATELGYSLGPLTTVSMRAHIYEEPWKQARDVLSEYGHVTHGFDEDPRGNFIIDVLPDGNLVLSSQDGSGEPLRPDISWDGRRKLAVKGLAQQITKIGGISDPGHGMYLGEEITMATVAARLGLPYIQNNPEPLLEVLQKMAAKAHEFDKLKERGII